MPGESAMKLERFGAKHVSEILFETAKKAAARGNNVPIRGKNSPFLVSQGAGKDGRCGGEITGTSNQPKISRS